MRNPTVLTAALVAGSILFTGFSAIAGNHSTLRSMYSLPTNLPGNLKTGARGERKSEWSETAGASKEMEKKLEQRARKAAAQ